MSNNNSRLNIVSLNCTQSYPIRFTASNTKMEYIARGVMEQGASVTIINDVLGHKGLSEDKDGTCKGIRYYIFNRKKSTVRNVLRNMVKAHRILKHARKKDARNVMFCGGIFPVFPLNILVGKLLGYKCVFLIQEWNLSFNNRSLLAKISAYCACKVYGYFMDGILPISHFLEEKMAHFHKPMLMMPVLSDYAESPDSQAPEGYNHFAYCVDAGYFRVITMMIDAFATFKKEGGSQKLVLILSGRDESVHKVKEYVQAAGLQDSVDFRQQVPYAELLEIYRTALALIIPLNPESLQDQARFSQKIAEYVSTKRPIITSSVGEIPYYFTDGKDAVLVEYNAQAYAEAFRELANDEASASEIGKAGYNTGRACFDYRRHGAALKSFFENL